LKNLYILLLFLLLLFQTVYGDNSFSLFGTPKYKENFKHFDYVNPQAPKQGDIKLGIRGTFDSFNPFILKDISADNINLIYDTLLVKSQDEIDSYYGLLAEDIIISDNYKKLYFKLREQAKFHDEVAVTSHDVKFTFELLQKNGSPSYKQLLSQIKKINIISDYEIEFIFNKNSSRDIIATIGTIEILPKHFWKDKNFKKSSLVKPLGSGAYKITEFKVGNYIKFERVKNYWGKDLAVNRGRYNFNSITLDYYRDETVLFQAFKSLNYYFRFENISKNWVMGYKNLDNRFTIEEIKNSLPQGMQGFFFNTRKEIFQDWRVRKGIALAFDFELTNKNLFYNQYKRTNSYFANSPYSTDFYLPKGGGSYQIRPHLREAMKLLNSSGWFLKNGKLEKNGQKLSFTIDLLSPSFVRIVLPYKRNLAKIGIELKIKMNELGQYIKKLRTLNFDMVVYSRGEPLLLGGEQRNFWHSSTANIEGTQNIAGVQNPKIDRVIEKIENSKNLKELIQNGKKLDKLLLENWYVVPHWYIDKFRVAYWNRIKRPKITPLYDLNFNSWWFE
jgi:microcin C transport system substrate-binding protein